MTTPFLAPLPLTAIERGLTHNVNTSAVRTSNTETIQAAIDEGLDASRYAVMIPAGRWYVNALTTPHRIGGMIWGGGGVGWQQDDFRNGDVSQVILGDTDLHATEAEHDVDALKEPLFLLNTYGSQFGFMTLMGRDPDLNYHVGAQGDCALQVPTDSNAISHGKHTIWPCVWQHWNRAIYFGDGDGGSNDNADTTCIVGYHRFVGCLAAVTLDNYQTQPIKIDFLHNANTLISLDVRYGGIVDCGIVSHNAPGGIVVNLGPADKAQGAAGVNNPSIHISQVHFDPPNGTNPTMLVNSEALVDQSYYHIRMDQVLLHEDFVHNGGANTDGGPCVTLRGAQKLTIGTLTKAYTEMIECFVFDGSIPQIFIADVSTRSSLGAALSGRLPMFAMLAEPAEMGSSDGYLMQVGRTGGWTMGDALDSSLSDPTVRRPMGVQVRHRGGVSREEYDNGDVVWRVGQRLYGQGVTVATASPVAGKSWTVPPKFNGWSITGFWARVCVPPTGGAISMSVTNATNGDAAVFSTPPTIAATKYISDEGDYTINPSNALLATSDQIDFNVTGVNGTPKGLIVYLEVTPP